MDEKTDKKINNKKSGAMYRYSKRIVYIALMSAILIACKFAIAFVPNIEVITTLTIVFAYSFGWPALAATTVFSLVDFILYPPSPDVLISYLIYWNLLAAITVIFKKCGIKSEIPYIVLSLVMTLLFGVLTTAMFVLFYGGNFFVIYAAGIVFYVAQFMSSLVFMSVGFKPLTKLLGKLA